MTADGFAPQTVQETRLGSGQCELVFLSALDTRVEEDLCFPAHMQWSESFCAVLRELLLAGGLLQVLRP